MRIRLFVYSYSFIRLFVSVVKLEVVLTVCQSGLKKGHKESQKDKTDAMI